jgi:hypothetical protein
LVSESRGLEFDPQPRTFLLRVIPAYRSPYSETHVAQTSGPPNRAAEPWLARSRGDVGT